MPKYKEISMENLLLPPTKCGLSPQEVNNNLCSNAIKMKKLY
jgi:hypothetical protein